jgi:hypothetical protein
LIPLLAASAALRRVHVDWAWVVIVSNAVVGCWALVAHRWARFRHPWLWRATAVAEVAIFVQVILGVILIQGRDTKPYQFHMFYGFIAAFTVAILYAYRAQLKPWWYLLYGFGGLFLMGLGLRALAVGPH